MNYPTYFTVIQDDNEDYHKFRAFEMVGFIHSAENVLTNIKFSYDQNNILGNNIKTNSKKLVCINFYNAFSIDDVLKKYDNFNFQDSLLLKAEKIFVKDNIIHLSDGRCATCGVHKIAIGLKNDIQIKNEDYQYYKFQQ